MGTFIRKVTPQADVSLDDAELEKRLQALRVLVAQPVPTSDPRPSDIGHGLFVGNKHHACNVKLLSELGVTAVLNCASSGIRHLPLDEYGERGIRYAFTNVAQDSHLYPILHGPDGVCSPHLKTARAVYEREVVSAGGKALFFCVAGMNRSATLAVAVHVSRGVPLQEVLTVCSRIRPFIIENIGFQRQLVELDAKREQLAGGEPDWPSSPSSQEAKDASSPKRRRLSSGADEAVDAVSVEVVVPGFRTFQVCIPKKAPITTVRECITKHVNVYLLRSEHGATLGTSWLIFTMFGKGGADDEHEPDLVLEDVPVDSHIQLQRLQSAFGLEVRDDHVFWTSKCRFELVIFSTMKPGSKGAQQAFTFRHEERVHAPSTLLNANMIEPQLRAWDFISGESFRSQHPIVFSYSDDPRYKRDFMNISTRKGERQQFNAPGEGGILGMGNNAIVHHVKLKRVEDSDDAATAAPAVVALKRRTSTDFALEQHDQEACWDAAVKRPFSLPKMLASIQRKAEAGVAKRLRISGALNRQGRLLDFYGLGIALAANNNDHNEFKFEATILSQYLEEFSTYTMKRFTEDYTTVTDKACVSEAEKERLRALQRDFSLLKVKVLLVSLLSGFRDLTLMGVQAYDFTNLNNVLISRDHRTARLIDIDGECKGSYDPAEHALRLKDAREKYTNVDVPGLEIDLSTLRDVVHVLVLGKGRGKPFVQDVIGRARRAKTDADAKSIVKEVIKGNFFNDSATEPCSASSAYASKHIAKVVEWFLALLFQTSPWIDWTADIYSAMRCIDHMPLG